MTSDHNVKLNENINKFLDDLPPIGSSPSKRLPFYIGNEKVDSYFISAFHFMDDLTKNYFIKHYNNEHNYYLFRFPKSMVKCPSLLLFETDIDDDSYNKKVKVYMVTLEPLNTKIEITRLVDFSIMERIRHIIRVVELFYHMKIDDHNLNRVMDIFK